MVGHQCIVLGRERTVCLSIKVLRRSPNHDCHADVLVSINTTKENFGSSIIYKRIGVTYLL